MAQLFKDAGFYQPFDEYLKLITDHLKSGVNSVIDSLKSDPKSWAVITTIGLVAFYLAKYYYDIRRYPPGPLPLPVIGNFMLLKGIKKNMNICFADFAKIYGPVYTFWMGPRPSVIITDFEVAKQGLLVKKNDIAGRPQFNLFSVLFEEGGVDIAFTDYGPTWESLRRVAHAAVRKYSVSEKLADLVADVVDDIVKTVKEKEGLEKPFVPNDYLYMIIFNVLASSAFGKRYTMDDPEFLRLKKIVEDQKKISPYVIISEFIPFIKIFLKKDLQKVDNNMKEYYEFIKKQYKDHEKDFQPGIVRDFTDAVMAAKQEAIAEGKESGPYLTDANLIMTVSDIFSAGSDTTNFTLRWILLFMANFSEMQRRMRKEVDDLIGDRVPVQDDKLKCHFTNAFISESLRFRLVAPMALPHKTLVDVNLNGYKIPKNTSVTFHFLAMMLDPKVFDHPDEFKPTRFLDETGKFLSTRPQGMIPFGMGRRSCPGEKLALADLFLVVVRLLQCTQGLEYSLPGGPGSANLEPDHLKNDLLPADYKIMLVKAT